MSSGNEIYLDFSVEIAEGAQPHLTPDKLEALLHWLVGRNVDKAKAIQSGFERARISKETAISATLTYLDATLFSSEHDPYRLFGLTPESELSEVRERHRRLLQVFHPDRHRGHKEWFTTRSEQLNRAYSLIKRNQQRPLLERGSTVQGAGFQAYGSVQTPRPRSRSRHGYSAKFQPDVKSLRCILKHYFGSSASLQRHLFLALLIFPLIVLTFTYVANRGNYHRVGAQPDPSTIQNENEQHEVMLGENGKKRVDSNKRGRPNFDFVVAEQKVEESPSNHKSIEHVETKRFVIVRVSPDIIASGYLGKEQSNKAKRNQEEGEIGTLSVAGELPKSTAPVNKTESHEVVDLEKTALGLDTKTETSDRHSENNKTADRKKRDEVEIPKKDQSKTPLKESVSTDRKSKKFQNDKTKQEPKISPELEEKSSKNASISTKNKNLNASIDNSANNDFSKIEMLLEEYKAAYRGSDIMAFKGLFEENAKTKHATGKAEIGEKYKKFFDKTRERRLEFSDVEIRLLGGRQFKVQTHYEASWTYLSGNSKRSTGKFELHIVPVGSELKIWRLMY